MFVRLIAPKHRFLKKIPASLTGFTIGISRIKFAKHPNTQLDAEGHPMHSKLDSTNAIGDVLSVSFHDAL